MRSLASNTAVAISIICAAGCGKEKRDVTTQPVKSPDQVYSERCEECKQRLGKKYNVQDEWADVVARQAGVSTKDIQNGEWQIYSVELRKIVSKPPRVVCLVAIRDIVETPSGLRLICYDVGQDFEGTYDEFDLSIDKTLVERILRDRPSDMDQAVVVIDVVDVKRRRLQVDAEADEVEVEEEMMNDTFTPEAYINTVEVPLDFVLIGKCIDIEVVHYPED